MELEALRFAQTITVGGGRYQITRTWDGASVRAVSLKSQRRKVILHYDRDGGIVLSNQPVGKGLSFDSLEGERLNGMLVLTRRAGESIMVDDDLELKVLNIRGSQVHLGIDAPAHATVHRKEVWLKIHEEQKAADPERADPVAPAKESA